MIYKIPFSYERYGYIPVDAKNEDEAYNKAEKILTEMTVAEMDRYADYLPESEAIDREGDTLTETGYIT